MILTCTDSDTALRALLAAYPDAHDIEVLGANLETAFLALTGDPVDDLDLLRRHCDDAQSPRPAVPWHGAPVKPNEAELAHLHALRAAADVPQPAIHAVLARVPAPAVLPRRGPEPHEKLGGINFATYYMVGMLSWGSMAAVIAGGARIAQERSVGWHRQLRITPLPVRTYFATKILSGYTLASLSIVLLYAAGMSMGVHLSVVHWLELTGYVLVALVPFAVIGIVLGHLLTVDSMGPALGGITSLFAILGGAWGPLASGGFLGSAGEVAAVVLAGQGRADRGRWRRVAGAGMDRHRDLDRRRASGSRCGSTGGTPSGSDRRPAPGAKLMTVTDSKLDREMRLDRWSSRISDRGAAVSPRNRWGTGRRRLIFPAIFLAYLLQTVNGVQRPQPRRLGDRRLRSAGLLLRLLPRDAPGGVDGRRPPLLVPLLPRCSCSPRSRSRSRTTTRS